MAAAGVVLATRAPVAAEVATPPSAVLDAAPPSAPLREKRAPAPMTESAPPVIESVPPVIASVPAEAPGADVDPDATRRPLDGEDSEAPAVTWRVVAEPGGDRPLFAGEGVTIGRVSDPDDPARIVVRSDVVSRRHAAVRLRAGVPVVVDLESVNGTWLFRDGAHVEVTTDGTPAADGDVVMTVDGVVLATIRSSGHRG